MFLLSTLTVVLAKIRPTQHPATPTIAASPKFVPRGEFAANKLLN